MFIRKRYNKSGSTSIQIVEKLGKSLRIIQHIGTASETSDLSKLIEQANHELYKSQIGLFNSSRQIENAFQSVEITHTYPIGYQEVFGHLYDLIGYSSVINEPLLKQLVIARIVKPTSKLGITRWLQLKTGLQIHEDQVYRLMDILDDTVERNITDHTYHFTKKILKEEIHMIFFDATTLHFETFTPDTLRKTGFSKVGKHNQPQIVVGLMVSKGGFPIGYDVYPGNEFDGHTIRSALRRVSRRYSVKDVVFIADNAMMSDTNIELIEKSQFKFIMAARIKSMSNHYKEQILDMSKYKKNIREIEYGKRRLIVSYSEERARKDRTDREKNLEQIKKRLTKRNTITKTKLGKIGKSKYLSVDGEAEVSINYEAVRADEVWDGLKGYMTNIPQNELSADEILSRYSDLWQIEKAFKVAKNDLRMRPIFHRKRQRVRAHILLVFMSLVVSRYADHLLKHIGISTNRLVELLENAQVIEIESKEYGIKIRKRTPLSEQLQTVYSILKIVPTNLG